MIHFRQPTRTICNTAELISEAVVWAAGCDLLATDVETIPHISRAKKPQPEVMTVVAYSGVTNGVIRSYAFQLTRQKSSLDGEHPLATQSLLAIAIINANNVRKALHNGVYDSAWFVRYCVPLSNYAYDSMTMWWSRYPDLPKTLDFVASILLDDYKYWKMGRKEEDFTSHTMYAMSDTEVTLRCVLRLLQWMQQDRAMLTNFHLAHMRCLTGLAMSLKGMEVDDAVFDSMGDELKKKTAEALAKFQWMIDDEEVIDSETGKVLKKGFNPNSTPAKLELFYDLLGAKKRNAKGRELKRLGGKAKVSTGAVVLRAMRSDHPILRRVVDGLQSVMEPSKQVSNVIGLEFMGGRFRTGYDGIGTTTSRLSSRKDAFGYGGNAQNLRKKYRRFLRAERGKFILEIDFSAADDIFVSYESEEPRKIEIIEKGYDTHSFNASEVFFTNWEYERVVAGKKEFLDHAKTITNPDYVLVTHPITGIRQITKKTTHGCNYLMAGQTLLNSAGREAIVAAAKHLGHLDAGLWGANRLIEFCDWLDSQYRRYYPRFARSGSTSFYAELSLGLRQTRGFKTIFGYTQRFLADPLDDGTLRACAATVGQANTAGRVNMAMLELDQGIRTKRFRDGDAPDFDDKARPVNEKDHGISLRLQTHDSLTFVCDADHNGLEEGLDNVFRVLRRPVVCKGRTFAVGLEGDCAIHWAHETETVHDPAGVLKWAAENKELLFAA